MKARLLLALFSAGAMSLLVAAGGEDPKPLPGCTNTKERALKWFTSEEEQARKDQMKEGSRALKRPCKYCHDGEDLHKFVDEGRRELVQQMMIVSTMGGFECKDCHDGKEKMTERGDKAAKMWDVSRDKKVFCDDCHQDNKSKFKDLTDNGKKYKDEVDAKKKAEGGAPASAPASAP